MDALQLLKSDHDTVRKLFQQWQEAHEAGDEGQQASLTATIIDELQLHTSIEEQVFYPAVRQVDEEVEALVLEGLEEHHVADRLIEELQGLATKEEAYTPKMQVLIENIEHHAEEEESELFPKLREYMDQEQLEQLGAELEQAKHRGEHGALSKQELYEKAKEQNVAGRSKMTKEELSKAVQ
jgi:hemerythrin superfamily protein